MAIPSEKPTPIRSRSSSLLLIIAFSLWAGTAAGLEATTFSAFVLGFALIIVVSAFLFCRMRSERAGAMGAFVLVPAALLAGIGNGASSRPETGRLVPQTDQRAYFSGTVWEVEHLYWGRRATIDLSSIDEVTVKARVRLTLPESAPSFRSGDFITGYGQMLTPTPPKNPGEFDLPAALEQRGIQAIGRAHDLARISSGRSSLTRRVDAGRDRVRQATKRAAVRAYGVGDRYADERLRVEGVLRALSLGEGAAVPAHARKSFASAGLAHLLAVSGLHLGLFAAGLFAVVRWLMLLLPGRSEAGPRAALIIAPVVGLLVTWVGHPPSATRAGLMALVVLGAVAMRRRLSAWTSLALAAICLIVLQPPLCLRPGFQLSFAAVAGLLAIAGRQLRHADAPAPRGGLWRRTRTLGEVTLAATLATAPLCAIHFQMVPLLGNLANLVAVPLTSLVVPSVAAATVSTLVAGEAADPLWIPATLGVQLLLLIAQWASDLPAASVYAPSPGVPALFASVLGLFLAARKTRPLHRVAATMLVLLPLVLSGMVERREPPDAPLEVVFLSVGHGDSTLVRTAKGDILIDAGGSRSEHFDVGERRVVPALRALGVDRLEAVIVTHWHIDHFGGIPAVLDAFPVATLFHGTHSLDEAHLDIIAHAERRGSTIHRACRDPLPDLAPAVVECVHPHEPPSHLSHNDASIVLRVDMGDVSFLFTGDIESEAESLILKEGRSIAATVVKAPHHGSSTSSTQPFVNATGADHVVFSSGRASTGFPSPKVVERWLDAEAIPWWTHHHGAVHFKTDGYSLEVRPFLDHVEPRPARASLEARTTRRSNRPAQTKARLSLPAAATAHRELAPYRMSYEEDHVQTQ